MANSKTELAVERLLQPDAYPHIADELQMLETHISWVFLAGNYAYKVKKPVNFGFLDYSTLELRRRYCQEELRLNARLAPHIYLDVVPLRGSLQEPHFKEEGEIIDYAVKMRRFSQSGLLDRQIQEGRLQPEDIDELSNLIAQFHQSIERIDPSSHHGTPENVHQPAIENFDHTVPLIQNPRSIERLGKLKQWTEREYEKYFETFKARQQEGFVRECHGDLHLGNMARMKGILIFDGIEFNDDFRWIDVVSEIAFLYMDLEHRGRPDFAQRMLNRYLERTGDYLGLSLLPYYLVYRSMVRAKVDAIRFSQSGLSEEEKSKLSRDFVGFIDQAERYAATRQPHLVLTHGLSGSGKTFVSGQLLEKWRAVRIRSDVERKRLFGLDLQDSSHSEVGKGLYTPEASRRTFQHLRQLASGLLKAGQRVIVDATFLKPDSRRPFYDLAVELKVPLTVLDVQAGEAVCRRRLQEREDDVSEANLAVLENQLGSYQALHPEEARIITLNSEQKIDIELLIEQLKTHL